MATECTIIVRTEKASERRLDAQYGEVAAGDEHSRPVHGLSLKGQFGPEKAMGGDAGENRLLALIPEEPFFS
jgi:hypothetical protein